MSRTNRSSSSLASAIILAASLALSLARPAAAEKVVYLLQEIGQASAVVDLDPKTGQQFSFLKTGPFYPNFSDGFYIPSSDPSDYSGIQVNYIVQRTLDGYYDVNLYTSAEVRGSDPQNEQAIFSLDWRLQVADEPVSLWASISPAPAQISVGSLQVRDSSTGEVFSASNENIQPLCILQPGHVYDWNLLLSASSFADGVWSYSSTGFDGAQLLPVPEPDMSFLVFPAFVGLLFMSLRSHHWQRPMKNTLYRYQFNRLGKFLFLMILLKSVVCLADGPRTFYIQNDGSVTDPNGSLLNYDGFREVIRNANLQPGDNIFFVGGIHQIDTRYRFTWPSGLSGTAAAPITVTSVPGQTAILQNGDPNTNDCLGSMWQFNQNNYLIIGNLQIKNVVAPFRSWSYNDNTGHLEGSHHLTFQNLYFFHCDFPGGGNHGNAIDLRHWNTGTCPPHDIAILNTTIESCSEAAIRVDGGVYNINIDNVTITNIFDHAGDSSADGITFNYSDANNIYETPYDANISNVHVSNIGADGIDLKARNVTISYCTVQDCQGVGVKLWGAEFWDPNVYSSFVLRNVTVVGAGEVGCKTFYMPYVDIQECSFWSNNEQGFLYRWWSSEDAGDCVPVACWNGHMRLLRNVFATSNPDQSAVEIVTKHIDPNGNYAQIVLDANSADNDAFWCGSDPNCADDPNNCDSNCNLLWVHDYGTTGASYRKADMLAGLSYTAIIEYSGNVKKSIPVYSPPADFNLDGVVDHVDFLAWQAGYPRSTGGTKRNGDANRDGKVDGCDFDIWQSAFPWTPADFNSDSHVDGNDFFIWRAHYPTASGATHAMGDADGDGVVDYTDFLIWHQAIGLDYSPPADFNDDCKVDGVDFLVWQSHYPTNSGATKAQGDANGDGKVDGVDYLIWQNWYGQGGWPPAAPGDDNDNMVAGQNLHPTLIDYNGDGVITPDEVSRLFSSLGEDQ